MANPPARTGPIFEEISMDTFMQYRKLRAKQKEEEAEFKKRVLKAQSDLKQRHATETRVFWKEHACTKNPPPVHGDRNAPHAMSGPGTLATDSRQDKIPAPAATDPPTIKSNILNTAARNGTGSSTNRPVSRPTTIPKPNPNVQKPPGRNLPAPVHTSVPKTQRSSAAKNPVVVEISDDEEPQPAKRREAVVANRTSNPSGPSASLVFFSDRMNSVKSQTKQENRLSDAQDPNPSPFVSHGSPIFSPTSSLACKKPIPSDPQPEIHPRFLREQQIDRSGILASPPRLPRDPGLLYLQQHKKNGGFVGSVLRNERSQGWAPGLGKVFEHTDGDDVETSDVSQVGGQPTASSCHVFGSGRSLGRAASELRAESALDLQHKTGAVIASPPKHTGNDANASRMDGPVNASQTKSTTRSTSHSPSGLSPNPSMVERDFWNSVGPERVKIVSYKVPALPARSATGNLTLAKTPDSDRTRESSNFSQASSHSLATSSVHALNNLRTQREASATTSSITDPSTPTKAAYKRKKVVSVSSDNESEFEPSPQLSPAWVWKAKRAAKKAKATSASASSTPSDKAESLGFKSKTQQKGGRPVTPPQSSAGRSAPSTPGAPKGRKTRVPTPSSPTPSSFHSALRRLNPRPAKVAARNKINDYVKATEEFETEEQIRAADEKDERLNNAPVAGPAPDQLRQHMRGLSLTPALSHGSGASDDGVDRTERDGSVYSSRKWTRDRMYGDRYLAKSMVDTQGQEESEGELDYGAINAKMVDGSIVFGPIEEMDLTGMD